MKVAFVCDWLVFRGGAEKVFFDIIYELTGNSKNYYFSKKELDSFKLNNKFDFKIFTSFYNKSLNLPYNIDYIFSNKLILNHYRNLFPLFPVIQNNLSKKINNYNPDLVIISSFAIAKNLDLPKNIKKILYLHSPMQYVWSHYDEYLNKFSGIKKIIYKLSSTYIKRWDLKYKNFDYIIANSNYTKNLSEDIYKFHVDKVVFPKVEIPAYKKVDVFEKYGIKSDYYLYIGRLVKLVKNLDKIIEIFTKIPEKELVIVGDGPDKEYLKKIAGKNIKFLGFISDSTDDYWNLIENAKAVINLTKESYGIVNFQVGKIGTKLISLDKGAINDIPGDKVLLKNIKDLENYLR